ncbi:MAG: hypothetical protein RLZZ502_1106, partial [Pseudomonadota bacterium]
NTYPFGTLAPNTTSTRTFTIVNPAGSSAIALVSNFLPSGYSVVSGGTCPAAPFALAINSSCTMVVRFDGASTTPAPGTWQLSCTPTSPAMTGASITCSNVRQTAGLFAAVIDATLNMAVPALGPVGLTLLILSLFALMFHRMMRRQDSKVSR